MSAYYNEIDPYAAEWLRNLIKAGHIADGEVDERSIVDVRPDDVRGFDQCHFFAGIGIWSYALRLAGWPDDRPVWTGSCPCQPFSATGKRKGTDDERHLWPVFYRLIAECRPPVVAGEQVASTDGLKWLDSVLANLEASDYAAGAVDMCAAGVGAPHIRQRLWWVGKRLADATGERRDGVDALLRPGQGGRVSSALPEVAGSSATGRLADADGAGLEGRREPRRERAAERSVGAGGVAGDRPSTTDGFWRDADWLFCRDGRWRSVEPGTFPLAHGSTARVGRLRAYGNAIVAPVAATFIRAVMEARP